jgi:hypothetical protein
VLPAPSLKPSVRRHNAIWGRRITTWPVCLAILALGCGRSNLRERQQPPNGLELLDWPTLVTTLHSAAPDLPQLELSPETRPYFYDLLDIKKASVFGELCDYGGMPPDGRIAIVQLVARKQVVAVRYLLRFGSLAGRTYAAEALHLLHAWGEPIVSADLSRIAALQRSREALEVCRGCIHTIETPASVLTPESLAKVQEAWSYYEKHGWAGPLPKRGA